MRTRWRDAWRAELPDVSRSQARSLVVTLGSFWGCYAIAAPSLDEKRPVGLVAFVVGFAAGWAFYLTLARVWGTRLFVLPGRGYFEERQRQLTAIVSLFRPDFIRRVFRATAWPPPLVGVVLLLLLATAILAG